MGYTSRVRAQVPGSEGLHQNLFICFGGFLSFLIRKILCHSERFGIEENKHERKVFLYPEIGVGGGGPA